jgi:Uma2 family endonuclease
MPAAPTQTPEIAESALSRKRFTTEEVERLLEAGFFAGERWELIDGDLINKMGQNPPHALAVRLLLKWLASFLEADLILVQLPMQAAGEDKLRSLPEPDFAVLRERTPEHRHHHPRGAEMLLVIEVSDTTAAFDLSRKAALYARAGVREYWVLDIPRRMIIVHREPDGTQYRQIFMHSEEEPVSPEGRSESVRVLDLLPPS